MVVLEKTPVSYKKTYDFIKHKFLSGFRWNLWGSVLFETLKILHHVLLLHFLPTAMFGTIGTIFAVIYLSSRIADFGISSTLPPFFGLITKSKNAFKQIFLRSFLFPLICFATVCAFTAHYFYLTSRFIFPLLVISETIRVLLRQFLHLAFKTKTIIMIELALFAGYLAILWSSYFMFGFALSYKLIFVPHLLNSFAALFAFSIIIYKHYQAFPDTITQLPLSLNTRIMHTQGFNYLLRLSRNVFTSNLLTPLFAYKFGLAQAGLFYLASTIATSTRSIVKSSIGYSGGALLAHLKDRTSSEKIRAFSTICNKLVMITVPLIIFMSCNYSNIIKLGATKNLTGTTIAFLFLYLVITGTEFFFILYEQFYIVEEAAKNLFLFKILEFLCFYFIVISQNVVSPIIALVSIIAIRFVSLLSIAIHAYYRWRIKPTCKISWEYVGSCIALSLCCSIIFFLFQF